MTFLESFDAQLLPRPTRTPAVPRPDKSIGDMTTEELCEYDDWIRHELEEIAWHHSVDKYRSELAKEQFDVQIRLGSIVMSKYTPIVGVPFVGYNGEAHG